MPAQPPALPAHPCVEAANLTQEDAKAFYQNYLSKADECAESIVRQLTDEEEFYVETGRIYHNTRLATRNPYLEYLEVWKLEKLKEIFEISTPEEYTQYFAPRLEEVRLANELRQHTGKAGSLGDLEGRTKLVCNFLARLIHSQHEFATESNNLRTWAVHLADKDRMLWGSINWADPQEEGEGYDLAKQWVLTFPETQRMLLLDTNPLALDRLVVEVVCPNSGNPDRFVEDNSFGPYTIGADTEYQAQDVDDLSLVDFSNVSPVELEGPTASGYWQWIDTPGAAPNEGLNFEEVGANVESAPNTTVQVGEVEEPAEADAPPAVFEAEREYPPPAERHIFINRPKDNYDVALDTCVVALEWLIGVPIFWIIVCLADKMFVTYLRRAGFFELLSSKGLETFSVFNTWAILILPFAMMSFTAYVRRKRD